MADTPTPDDAVLDEMAAILDELEREDKLTADAVVAKAEDPDSPLHGYFEWDDTAAAHQYRLEQGRALIRRLRIVVQDESGNTFQIRRTVFVSSQGIFKNTARALRENHDEVLADCMREFEAFRRKWEHLKEFDRIIRGQAA